MIFLEAWFNELDKYRFQRELLQIIMEAIDPKDVGIKRHPNNIHNEQLYYKNNIIEGISSFELNNIYYSLNDKILISIISTASLTPKIIYDEEPYVIFLFKIFWSRYYYPEWRDTEKVIHKIKRSYDDPSKIMIPETISELKVYLKKMNSVLLEE